MTESEGHSGLAVRDMLQFKSVRSTLKTVRCSGNHYHPRRCLLHYAITDSGEKVTVSFQRIKKITQITALRRGLTFGCNGQRTQAGDASEGALKDKDLSSSLFPSIPPLQHGEVTGKIKGENGGTGGATGVMAMQLGSLLPCLTQRDKSWLFMCLSVSPAFYQVRGETAVTPTRGTGPNGALNRLAATP